MRQTKPKRIYSCVSCDHLRRIRFIDFSNAMRNYANQLCFSSKHTHKQAPTTTYIPVSCSRLQQVSVFLSDDVSCVVRHRTRVASAHNCFTRFSVPQSTQCCECSNVLCIYLSSCCSQHPSKWSQIYVQCDLANYNHAPTFRLSISMWSTLNHFKVLHACVCVYCIRICNRNGKLRIGWKRKGLQQLIVL